MSAFAQIDRPANDLDGAHFGQAIGTRLKDEQRAATGAAVATFSIHQREHIVDAICIEIDTRKIVVVGLDGGVDDLHGGLNGGLI